MSDYAHSDHRPKLFLNNATLESRALYGACYMLFLTRAVIKRLAPWRRRNAFSDVARKESIFSEAATAASVIVSSSFMGM